MTADGTNTSSRHATEPQSVLLTACVIVEHEDDDVAGCVASLTDLADEILVVSSQPLNPASKAAITELADVHVVPAAVDPSESSRRNLAVRRSRGVWTLVLDGDDSVQCVDPVAVRDLLAGAPLTSSGFIVSIEHLPPANGSMETAFSDPCLRIVRTAQARFTDAPGFDVVDTCDGRPMLASGAAPLSLRRHDVQPMPARHDDSTTPSPPPLPCEIRTLARLASACLRAHLPERALGYCQPALAGPRPSPEQAWLLLLGISALVDLERHEEAASWHDHYRSTFPPTATSRFLEARIQQARGEHGAALDLIFRTAATDLDEGYAYPDDLTRRTAQALSALGRHLEASDVLLSLPPNHWGDPSSRHLDMLLESLRQAGRPMADLVARVRPEQMLTLLAHSLNLQLGHANELLDAVYAGTPEHRLAVVAAASRIASRLSVADALRWSARLREHGLAEACPLVAIATTADRDLPERLQAAASGYKLFADSSFVALGRDLLTVLSVPEIDVLRGATDSLCPGFVDSCLALAAQDSLATHDDPGLATAEQGDPVIRAGGRPGATIVILAWNAWDHTKKCLDSLRRSISPQDQVVVVDNGSTDKTGEHLVDYPWLEVVTNPQNRGFAAGCNDGARHARKDVIIFLNNDTVVPACWLDGLLEPFADPSVAATGPRSNGVSGTQLLQPVPYSSPLLPEFERFASAWSAWCKGQVVPVPRLVGFCMAIRRDDYLAVGGFDESYGLGGFEDDDLCRKLVLRGRTLLIANACYVHHDAHSSFVANDLDWYALQCANQDLFEKKWTPPTEIPEDHTHFLAVQP